MDTVFPPVFLPGSTIGLMGSGQLGRMFALEARKMGYRIHTFSPERDTPTGQVADKEICAAYEDEAAVRAFARSLDVLTFEFENIPARCIDWAAQHCTVRPAGSVLHTCQHRLREKVFLREAGLPLAPFATVDSEADLLAAIASIGLPAVLKTAAFGYDGKGQKLLRPGEDLADAWRSFQGQTAVLEAWIPFEKEISVLVARGVTGETLTYPVCENIHSHHILDVTLAPARVDTSIARDAAALAVRTAEALGLVGVLAVEMFLLPDGHLLINELAPRPHNSGHFSFDASVTSQFEQQLRAVCGLHLGSTDSLRPAAMANLLGDLWANGEPDWRAATELPNVKIHLYGKAVAKPGRKMGHLVAFGSTVEAAADLVRAARRKLQGDGS
jgi:5-(carboxyamino)imidazole ribonucleotide synthase